MPRSRAFGCAIWRVWAACAPRTAISWHQSSAVCGWSGGRAAEPRLQAQDRLRVQLRDARLGDAEHLADLAESQLLVVVERDHELLALGHARALERSAAPSPSLAARR